ncbi:hypothetical protein [Endozoicomonas sp. ONNA1]|uniref:hypothetical protein n=1 Tax=Endozoicomonas sp. ONNA1 TaxID=2828740 RepID=UPI0021472B54|nr:hypothetical protein [Endozoicomonas sp. ONNA1]
MEAIDHQYSGVFRKLLVEKLSALQELKKIRNSNIRSSGISKLILNELGVTATIELASERYDAFVHIPQIDSNHTLINEWRKFFTSQSDAILNFNFAKKLKGSVDLQTSKVSGIFSKVHSKIFIGEGFFQKNGKFSADELGAIITHELGHLFTYYEHLSSSLRTNFAMAAVADRWSGLDTKSKKMELLEAVEDLTDIDFDGIEDLANTRKPGTVNAIIVGAKVHGNRSQLGTDYHDENSYEFLADQFASRHGFSISLASALDKIYKMHYHPASFSATGFFLLEVVKVVTTALTVIGGSPVLLLLFLAAVPIRDEYDPPKARIKRIKGDLIDRLKKKKIPIELTKEYLEQLETLNTIEETLNDYDGLFEYMAKYVLPWRRKQFKAIEFQKDLEALVGNALFASAKKIEVMGDR